MENKNECSTMCIAICRSKTSCNGCMMDNLNNQQIIDTYKKWKDQNILTLECYDLFENDCKKYENCNQCPYGSVSDEEMRNHYRLWGDGERIINTNKKSDLDKLIESEEIYFQEKQPTAKIQKEKKYSALAIFEIDTSGLYKKNDKTYYSPASHTWKDGIVFKFPRGIPEKGTPCIAIFKYDVRNKYHDFIAGKPCTQGRGMPYSRGASESGKLKYGIRPMVHIYPAVQDPFRDPIRYRLVLANWTIKNTSRGGKSSGSMENCEAGKVIYSITGADTSASGNHGSIWICAIVEGSPQKRIIRVANDTCNIREFVENI